MSFLKACTALLCLSFILLPLATANEHDDAAENETTETSDSAPSDSLEPVIVTGTLGPRTIGESLSSVTVIDEEQLRRERPAEFSDLLRGQPGIDVVTNGSFGKNTSIYTRGTGSESTILLVDGVRLRSATSGAAPWQYFPMALVERVEVVRGPRSSLYGADAVGGVIQAFTLDPDQGQTGWLEAGAGNLNTQKYSGGAAARFGRTRVSLSGAFSDTDGAPVVEDGESKGFTSAAGLGRVTHELPSGGEVSAALMQSQGNTEFEGGNTDYLIRTIGLGLTTPITDDWLTSFQLSEARDSNENERDLGDSSFDTHTLSARWENSLFLRDHELLLGAELQYDEVESTTEFEESTRANSAIFSLLRLNFDIADLQFALRQDDNEAYGNYITGGVAAGYKFGHGYRIRASYGTSFRAPTFNDLYYPLETFEGGGSYKGNPDLNPEEGRSVEFGIGARYENWYWDAAVYQSDTENLIIFQTTDGDMRPINVSEARTRGFELSTGVSGEDWKVNLSATVMNPRDQETGNRLPRRASKTLRMDFDRKVEDWDFGGSVSASGDRYNDASNDLLLPGFVTADVRAGWEFTDNWFTRLEIYNVTNNRYTTACCSFDEDFNSRNYVAAGTSVLASLRYEFR